MNKRLASAIRNEWLWNRLSLHADPAREPFRFNAEQCSWHVSDKRTVSTARREFVESGWIDKDGLPLDQCMAEFHDTDPSDALDRHVAQDHDRPDRGIVLDFDWWDHADHASIAAWVGRHPEGVTRVDQWGKPCEHGDHFLFPALTAAYARKKHADRLRYAVAHNLAYLLCEMRGLVSPEDKDVFRNAKNEGFGGFRFGLDPDKWGAEAETYAERLRVSIRDERRALAAVEKAIDGVGREGGWESVVAKYREDIVREVEAEKNKEECA